MSLTGEKSNDTAVIDQDPILKLADEINNQHIFKTMRDNREIYHYHKEKGIYVKGGEGVIEELCQTLERGVRNHSVQEVIGQISRRTREDREKFDSNVDIIVVENGRYYRCREWSFEHSYQKYKQM